MKKYVFEEYRDAVGVGSEKIFNTKEIALGFAIEEWKHLFERDKASYRKDEFSCFRVFEIEITPEQLAAYENDCLDIALSELETEEVYNALDE